MKKLLIIFLSLFLATSAWALELQITVPAEIEADTIEAFAQAYGYQEEIDGKPNPETKEEFTIKMIARFPQEVYRSYMTQEAEGIKQERARVAKEKAKGIKGWKIEEVVDGGKPEEPQPEVTF